MSSARGGTPERRAAAGTDIGKSLMPTVTKVYIGRSSDGVHM